MGEDAERTMAMCCDSQLASQNVSRRINLKEASGPPPSCELETRSIYGRRPHLLGENKKSQLHTSHRTRQDVRETSGIGLSDTRLLSRETEPSHRSHPAPVKKVPP